MSEHSVNVVRVPVPIPHLGADRLSVLHLNNYTVVVGKDEFKEGDLAVYVEPDYIVDTTRPEFSFLGSHARIKVRKFRGVVSQGLLVPLPAELAGAKEGDDVMAALGITRYEPPAERESTNAQHVRPPADFPKYDVESWYKYSDVLVEGEQVLIAEKLDGCVTNHATITMADGTTRHLADVKRGDYVLGVGPDGRPVPSLVIKKHYNGRAEAGWLKIAGPRRRAGRGNNTFALVCTPEHKVFNASRGNYIAAKDTQPGDTVLAARSDIGLSPVQEQVLLGKLLGDGSLRLTNAGAYVSYGHRIQDAAYCDWTARGLANLDNFDAEDYPESGFGTTMVRRRTHCSYWIRQKFESFLGVSGRKHVPVWVEEELTPLAAAFWYMDDGSLEHGDNQEDRVSFAVCGFGAASCEILVRALRRLGVGAFIKKYRNHNYIKLHADDAERFFLLVAPYIPPCMQRKLPPRYRGHAAWMPDGKSTYKQALVPLVVEKVTTLSGEMSHRYDLSTETHNYFAHGVLVHNCNLRGFWQDGQLWLGSRRYWVKDEPGNVWWEAARQNPWLEEYCRSHPEHTLYGEVYGHVGKLTYGLQPKKYGIRLFDIMCGGRWLSCSEWPSALFPEHWVPVVGGGRYTTPVFVEGRVRYMDTHSYSADHVKALAEGQSLIQDAGHMREGIVIRPIVERWHDKIGRAQVKVVSNTYLEKY